jgi:replication initiation and membrane attachment protein DnaB
MRYLESGDTKQPEKDKTRYVKTKGKVTPDWYVHDYKNETTPEEQKELEKIKKELSDSMKKKEE